MDDSSCDIVMMVTSLHHIDDKGFMIGEIKRILKEKGRLVIIEFYKEKTPFGPSVGHRMSQKEVETAVKDEKLKRIDQFSMGANFYCFVYELS